MGCSLLARNQTPPRRPAGTTPELRGRPGVQPQPPCSTASAQPPAAAVAQIWRRHSSPLTPRHQLCRRSPTGAPDPKALGTGTLTWEGEGSVGGLHLPIPERGHPPPRRSGAVTAAPSRPATSCAAEARPEHRIPKPQARPRRDVQRPRCPQGGGVALRRPRPP
ncbi:hypothetical protein ZWY2020_045890 [Hordeum vulgare]|nr:hypothetical protein ZWY2020_045890 [Hordeum vulgare]